MNMPNSVLFRLPLTEGTHFEFDSSLGEHPPAFAQMNIIDGQIVPGSVLIFTVAEGDSYRDVQLDQLVFATVENGSSKHVCTVTLKNEESGEPTEIWSVGVDELNEMLPAVLTEVSTMKSHTQVVKQ